MPDSVIYMVLTFSMEKQDRSMCSTMKRVSYRRHSETYLNNVWTGLMWLLLHRGLPAEAVFDLVGLYIQKTQ